MSTYAPTRSDLRSPSLRALRPSDRFLVAAGTRLTTWGERRAASHAQRTARHAVLDAAAEDRARLAARQHSGRPIA
ncbi:hypothetical protein [Oerskovia paurometabola]|uniref:Uncharacterized protein n=1 Tax=Oerskovia paurometabola TaxID=162170 RepID=A0ABW1X499_9CELL|nr:hypothetical protein [Oerskovia paurometabola]MBM7498457.1 hypothetical protein [Oerskovia paurometabola]